MAPTVTRLLSITYGGTTFAGTSDVIIDGYASVDHRWQTFSIEFTCLIIGTSATDFDTVLTAFENAVRTPDQKLEVIIDSQTIYTFDPASGTNTGFNARGFILGPGELGDTGLSAVRRIRIECDLPADLDGRAGRRDARIQVAFDANRRMTVTFTGTWTAITGKDSFEQYQDEIETFVTTMLGIVGSGKTFELVGEPALTIDENDKLLDFTRVMRQIIFNQSGAGLDNLAIVDNVLSVRVIKDAPGDTPLAGGSVKRLATVRVDWDAFIDIDVTQGLTALWTGTIRPFMIASARTILGSGAIAVIQEDPLYTLSDNRIGASLTIMGTQGGNVIEHRVTTDIDEANGKVIAGVWSGGPFAGYVYQGIGTRIRTTTEIVKVLGAVSKSGGSIDKAGFYGLGLKKGSIRSLRMGPFGMGGKGFSPGTKIAAGGAANKIGGAGGSDGWVELKTRTRATPTKVGLAGTEISITEIEIISVDQWVEGFTVVTFTE